MNWELIRQIAAMVLISGGFLSPGQIGDPLAMSITGCMWASVIPWELAHA